MLQPDPVKLRAKETVSRPASFRPTPKILVWGCSPSHLPPVVAFVLLCGSIWLLWTGSAPANTNETKHSVPSNVGLWIGKPVTVTDNVREILETDDVALMEYHLGEEKPIWFAQVAGFGNRAAFHPPELCYVGSHFEILERGSISVLVNGKEQKLMRLVVGEAGEKFEAWYWFTANGRISPNYYQQQLWLLTDAVRRKPMSGTMVRISTPLDEPASSRRRLLSFLTSWDGIADKEVRHDL